MSHFTVLVIAADHEKALQPFHEFECTGINDEFVQDIDQTDEVRGEYEADTITKLKAPDGTLHSFRDDAGTLRPEFSEPAENGRRKKMVPEGYEEVELPAKDSVTFAQWLDDSYSRKIVPFGMEPDTNGDHKYGYAMIDENGCPTKIVRRTNPNKTWDWYQVGGRWQGVLVLKTGEHANQALACEIDWDAMLAEAAASAGKQWDDYRELIAGRAVTTWKEFYKKVEAKELTIEQAREQYKEQPVVAELEKAKFYSFWDGAQDLAKIIATDRDEFVRRESQHNSTTWAMLHDGEWKEKGEMGWFGMSDATEDSRQDYVELFWQTVRALPADMKVTVVDCHI